MPQGKNNNNFHKNKRFLTPSSSLDRPGREVEEWGNHVVFQNKSPFISYIIQIAVKRKRSNVNNDFADQRVQNQDGKNQTNSDVDLLTVIKILPAFSCNTDGV